jgi:hypothetical protein
MITRLEKLLLLALACLTWLTLLLISALIHLGGSVPERPSLPAYAFRSYKAVKTAPITELLTSTVYARLAKATDQKNPFNCVQLFPVTPPPPKTRKIEVFYHGFFLTSHGEKHGYVTVDNKLVTGSVGTKVTLNLVITDMNQTGLTLRDDAGKETFLPFDTRQTLEIPAQ